MQEKIRDRISQAIKERVFPGCVVGIVKRGDEKLVLPCGRFTYEKSSPEVKENTIFDVASITKAIPTSSLALKLIDEGKLGIDDKLIKFLPELEGNCRNEILIKHLLTHTLEFNLDRLSSYKHVPEEILKVILKADLKTAPGRSFSYVNPTSILLGLVVERIYGKPLDILADEVFFKPLGMSRTTFWPLKLSGEEEIAPAGDGRTPGEVHDESAHIFMKSGQAIGAAGLFSTAPDLLNFLEILLNDGRGYFSPDIVKAIHTNQIGDLGHQELGWELNQPRYMGKHATEETFGKTGFTGCVVICDIGKGVGMVMLSNATYPERKPLEEHRETINAVRRDITDIVFASL